MPRMSLRHISCHALYSRASPLKILSFIHLLQRFDMADNKTISEAIGDDHKTIDSYADKIKSAGSSQEKTEWRNQFTWALARHAISEELTVYPSMEKLMGQEGLDLTNVDREQHQAVCIPPSLLLRHTVH